MKIDRLAHGRAADFFIEQGFDERWTGDPVIDRRHFLHPLGESGGIKVRLPAWLVEGPEFPVGGDIDDAHRRAAAQLPRSTPFLVAILINPGGARRLPAREKSARQL